MRSVDFLMAAAFVAAVSGTAAAQTATTTNSASTMEVTNLAFNDSPSVNSYMFNAVTAMPFGAEGNIQPYLSAGVGAIQLGGEVFEELDSVDTIHASHSTFGTNIGAGLLAFGNHIGFRTDLRYFHAASDDNLTGTTNANVIAQQVLSGLTYWRANLGLGFRW